MSLTSLLRDLLPQPSDPRTAQAWDEGYRAAQLDHTNALHGIHYQTPNPYRSTR